MPVRMPYPESWKKEYEKEHGKRAAHKAVRLNACAGRKLDFLRVLVALHEAGYFTDELVARLTGRTFLRRLGRSWGWIWTGPMRISRGAESLQPGEEGGDIRRPEESVCGV